MKRHHLFLFFPLSPLPEKIVRHCRVDVHSHIRCQIRTLPLVIPLFYTAVEVGGTLGFRFSRVKEGEDRQGCAPRGRNPRFLDLHSPFAMGVGSRPSLPIAATFTSAEAAMTIFFYQVLSVKEVKGLVSLVKTITTQPEITHFDELS